MSVCEHMNVRVSVSVCNWKYVNVKNKLSIILSHIIYACTYLPLQPKRSHIGVKIQWFIEWPISLLRWLSIPPCFYVSGSLTRLCACECVPCVYIGSLFCHKTKYIFVTKYFNMKYFCVTIFYDGNNLLFRMISGQSGTTGLLSPHLFPWRWSSWLHLDLNGLVLQMSIWGSSLYLPS